MSSNINYANENQFEQPEVVEDLVHSAKESGDGISRATEKAKEFIAPKLNFLTEKLKNAPRPSELAETATDFAKAKPGQALLISAGVGLVLGALIGRARR